MSRRILAVALVLAVAAPAFANAQDPEPKRYREREAQGEELPYRVFAFSRARLGITVQTKADPETDRYGAKIVSVLSDGPAEKAGLKAGDIITRFGSTNLAGVKPDDDEDAEASGPGLKLIELAQELDDGDSVKVDYRRDGNSRSATIVAQEIEPRVSVRQFRGPNMVLPKMEGFDRFTYNGDAPGMEWFSGEPGAFTLFMGRAGMQLVEMNSDLGEYFGTSEGLLVLRSPRDSTIPLRAGDVIFSIGGRKPTSVSHALRIIGSYDEGETVKVDIMRKRQRTTVEWTVKDREERAPRPTRERTRM
jgi:C-terminal processing protease CtpA/Prc